MPKKLGTQEHCNMCSHCGKLVSIEDKRLIGVTKYLRDDRYPSLSSNHTSKRTLFFSLCMECYSGLEKFFNSIIKFEQGVSVREVEN